MQKKKIFIGVVLAIISIITLKEFSDHVKLVIGLLLAALSAVSLNAWAAIVTILYGILQIGLLIPGYISLWKNRKNGN